MTADLPPSENPAFLDLYPERRGKKVEFSKLDVLDGTSNRKGFIGTCQSSVIKCLEEVPYLKLLWNAIETQGCKLDLSRNFSCEYCKGGREFQHQGTYDESTNQVVLCANNVSQARCCGTLIRNMIAMFDRCANKTDDTNVEHLACTEIRKANLAKCNYMVYLQHRKASFSVDQCHEDCVKFFAIDFLHKGKFVPLDKAEAAVEKVFDKCYKDLEPIGRRAISKPDMSRAYSEGYLFGYY